MLWFSGFVVLLMIQTSPANAQKVVSRTNVDRPTIRIKNALVKIAETVDVPVEQSGLLTELTVREGQAVQQGATIARVKNDTLTLKLDRARTEHELARMVAESDVDVLYSQKSFDVAQSDLRRSGAANQRVPNSVPDAKLEKQQLERDRTELQLQQAKRESKIAAFKTRLTSNDIRLAQTELNKTEVKAPMSGLVVAVEKRVGEWVESSNVVCRLVRTDRLRVEGFVPAEQASQIRVGTQVMVEFPYAWLQQKEVPGKVVFVSPEANPVNLNVQVWVEIPNPGSDISAGLRGDIVVIPGG